MFKVYTVNQLESWDTIVRSFKNYDIYWLNGYVKAFQIHGDGEPLLLYYEKDRTRGINVVLIRDIADDEYFKDKIPNGQYFDFATPYGYGGWIIEGDETAGLFNCYESWLKQRGIISEFVRFHPMIKNHVGCKSFYEVIQLGEVVHIDLSSSENIWRNLTSKNRNVIRKAIKNNVKVYNGRFPEIYKIFHEIYNETMDRDNADRYYYFEKEFYTSILEDLPENAQIFWAEKEGNVIAASIMLVANGRMNYHLSGSLREYSSLAATNLIIYKAALWGAANGCSTLYLGGGVGTGEDGLLKFKKAFFRGETDRFYIGRRIFDTKSYDELVNFRMKEDLDIDFFPMYRSKLIE